MHKETGIGIQSPLFFVGVVENNNDPRKEGRIQVRAFGLHGRNTDIASEDLPWATLVANPASVGNFMLPPLNSFVVGFFLDGRDAQQPLILGLLPSLMHEPIDPNLNGWGNIDVENYELLAMGARPQDIGSHNIPNLARAELVEETYVAEREAARIRNISIAGTDETWEEPSSGYNAVYPFNRVLETAAGHVVEIDDTPGSERIHIRHKSGSYIQVDATGSKAQRTFGDNTDITDGDLKVLVEGKVSITVNGDAHTFIKGNKYETVEGDSTVQVRGNLNFDVGGALTQNVGDAVRTRAAKIALEANAENISLKAANRVDLDMEGDFGVQTEGTIAFSGKEFLVEAKDGEIVLTSDGDIHLSGENVRLDDVVYLNTGTAHAGSYPLDNEVAALDDIPEAVGKGTVFVGSTISKGATGIMGTDE